MRKTPPQPPSGRPRRPPPIPACERTDSGKKRSLAQENAVAKQLGGRRVPGSGAFETLPGDVRTERYLIECKTTGTQSFTITTNILLRITREAFSRSLVPALQLTLEGHPAGEQDWILVPL